MSDAAATAPVPAGGTRRRRALRVALALGLGPLLLLLLGEAWVRWRHPAYADQWSALTSHPRWARTLRPSVSGRLRGLLGEYDTTFHIDAQGLREARDVEPKRPGIKRVVCVGDSNTFGLGVNDDQVWVRELAAAGVEPLNAGWAAGYAPDCAAVWLEEVGLGLEPDLVIQQLTPSNELDDLASKSVWETDASGRLVAVRHAWDRKVPPFLQALAFPRWLALQVLPALRGGPAPAPVPAGAGGALEPDAVEREGLRRLGVALGQERQLLQARGVRLLALLVPCPTGEPGATPGRDARHRAWIAAAVREAGIDLLDPADSPEWTGAARPVFYEDGHLTLAGNRALGRYAAREVARRLP